MFLVRSRHQDARKTRKPRDTAWHFIAFFWRRKIFRQFFLNSRTRAIKRLTRCSDFKTLDFKPSQLAQGLQKRLTLPSLNLFISELASLSACIVLKLYPLKNGGFLLYESINPPGPTYIAMFWNVFDSACGISFVLHHYVHYEAGKKKTHALLYGFVDKMFKEMSKEH